MTSEQLTPFNLVLFSATLVELVKSIPVYSLILSSHYFFCLPLLLFPFTVPSRIVFAKPEDLETCPNHLSFRFLVRIRSSSYSFFANLFTGYVVLVQNVQYSSVVLISKPCLLQALTAELEKRRHTGIWS